MQEIYDGNRYDRTDFPSEQFLRVNSCGVHPGSAVLTVRDRGRRDTLLLYVESGELTAVCRGGEVRIGQGGFVLYRAGEPQKYMQTGGRYFWVHFAGARVDEILEAAGLADMNYFVGSGASARISRAAEKLVYDISRQSRTGDILLASDLLALLSALGELLFEETAGNEERLRAVILHMNRHFAEETSAEQYAAMVGLGRDRFAHLFRETVGVSPHAYLLSRRLSYAEELLLSTDAAVGEIGALSGFADPLYFSRAFKRRYGLSPTAYRAHRLSRSHTGRGAAADKGEKH